MSIFRKNKKLYNLLSDCYDCLTEMKQFSDAQKCICSFLADREARALYEKLLDMEDILHSKQRDGNLSEEDLGKYKEINDQLLKLPGADNFFAAQEELESIHLQIMNFLGIAIETGQTPTPDEIEEYNASCNCDDSDYCVH